MKTMEKRHGLATGFAVLLTAALFIFAGCGDGGDGGTAQPLHTPRYQVVPYAPAKATAGGADYEIMLSAYDDTHNYYVLYLGYINRVPILFRNAVLWSGTPADGLTVGFSMEEATETMVSNSITTATSETISK